MPPAHPFFARLHRALQEEQRAEREQLAHWSTLSLDVQVAAGVAFPALTVEEGHWQGRRYRVTARAARGVWLHDGIDVGDAVWACFGSRTLPGVVRGQDGRVVDLTVDEPVDDGVLVEVRLRADPSTWVRYRQAIERVDALDTPLIRALRDLSIGQAIEEGARLDGLNPAQQDAADAALRASELAVIHGPPGTGKTRVLAAILQELVRRGDVPWALADSNAAVDNLALAAHRAGLDVVRVGSPWRMAPKVYPLTIEARISNGPLADAIRAFDKDIARSSDHRERRKLSKARRELHERARADVLQSAQVVASTFGSLGRYADALPQAHTAVVDEATQATEPALWVAVPYVSRLILVGDPEQLGPVSRIPGGPLNLSPLVRLINGGVPAPMLTVQHRMDRRLRRLVASVYGPSWTDHPSVVHQPLCDVPYVANTPLTRAPAHFIDTAGSGLSETLDPATRSLANEGEVALLQQVVRALREAGVRDADIAVTAPYSAQVARLKDAFPELEVATINAFQGRERPVMLVSWVRSNADGELGFVADGRRLTVALTRARHALIQVGDSATLAGHPRFAAMIDAVAEQGGLHSVFESPWDAVLA